MIAIRKEVFLELLKDKEFVSKMKKCRTVTEVMHLILEYAEKKDLSVKVVK